MSLADSNFGKTWGMRAIFLLKMLKIWSRFKKLSKKLREFFVFLETYLWIGCGKSSLLQTVYLLLAVHVLTVIRYVGHLFLKKTFKNWYTSQKLSKKLRKKIFISYIIEFDLVAENTHFYEENTCHRQTVCYKQSKNFTYPQQIHFPTQFPSESGKYDKSAAVKVLAAFGSLWQVDCQRVFWSVLNSLHGFCLTPTFSVCNFVNK